jgi:hypothetical protein
MRSVASLPSRWLLLVIASLAGCATVHPRGATDESPAQRYLRIRDSVDALASAAGGGVQPQSRPRIHLVVPTGVLPASRYVDASFRVSEDAYALVVAVDLDRRVRVLYPDVPDAGGFVRAGASVSLERVFAGFGSRLPSITDSRFDHLPGGLLFAIASARPLQLQRVTSPDGEWDEQALIGLLDASTPSTAVYQLGRGLTLTGQEFATDKSSMRGSGFPTVASALASYGTCGGGFDYFADREAYFYDVRRQYLPLVTYFVQDNQVYARYQYAGRCGEPRYTAPVPIGPAPAPLDTTRRDTTGLNQPAPYTPSGKRIAKDLGVDAGEAREHRAPQTIPGLRLAPADARPVTAARRWEPSEEDGGRTTRGQPRAEPVRTEPVHREPTRVEPDRAVPARAEPTRVEPTRAEPGRWESPRSESPRSESPRSESPRVQQREPTPAKPQP